MESSALSKYQKEQLRLRKEKLNPFDLKQDLEEKLKEFFELIRKTTIRKAA